MISLIPSTRLDLRTSCRGDHLWTQREAEPFVTQLTLFTSNQPHSACPGEVRAPGITERRCRGKLMVSPHGKQEAGEDTSRRFEESA
ncbi:hypothetical protein M8J75_002022 [Diaphorina citri]|nr:hypothetical protein M8J75_002022 [Diaphorina citri]